MRVIHVAPTEFGNDGLYGGGERYPLELARALARHVDCRLVTFGPRAHVGTEKGGLQKIVLKPALFLKGHPAHPVAARTLQAIRDAEIVHAHHMRSAPSRLAALQGRVLRQGVAVTDHGLGGGGWFGLLPRLFDLFLTVSRYSARTLGAPPSKTRVIYGGADTARFAPDEKAERNAILFVGRVTPHKGLDRLLQALPQSARLLVAGTAGHDPRPPERGYPDLLRKLAEGRDVVFLGGVSEQELPSLYRQARVFVLPSVHETCYGKHVEISELLGVACIEAMASGTPVVCSRLGGLPEVVSDGETGYLVEPGDVEELHDRLSELLADPRSARRMGSNARQRVIERFTWERSAQRCLAAYDELSGRGAA